MQKPLKKQISEKKDFAKRVINHVNCLIRDKLEHFVIQLSKQGKTYYSRKKLQKHLTISNLIKNQLD